jgi:hypothetical protein
MIIIIIIIIIIILLYIMCRKRRTHNYTHTLSFLVSCMEVAVASTYPKRRGSCPGYIKRWAGLV